MGTNIRRNLSTKNRYYLTKHRRLELEHFCLQYYEWERELKNLSCLAVSHFGEIKSSDISDPTFNIAQKAMSYHDRMRMVEQAADLIDIRDEIFIAVTTGKTYSYFEAAGAPFGRDLFYDRLRKFYYELAKIRR